MNHSSFINYILHLADTSLILGQRNGEWCGHGPILEQDIAITNITLDQVGQARNYYQHAAELINQQEGKNETEDSLAYLRNERDFKNLLLCELPKGDWAFTITRQFLYSAYASLLFEALKQSADEQVAAIAAKSLKEITYHLKWSSEWVIRLGDGTAESNQRMHKALEDIWPYTGEMFIPASYDTVAITALDIRSFKKTWLEKVAGILDEATLSVPADTFMQTGGKTGIHTEHMGFILAEMQSLQRAYPGLEW